MLFIKQFLSNLIIKEARAKILGLSKINDVIALSLRDPYRLIFINQLFYIVGFIFKSSGRVDQRDILAVEKIMKLLEGLAFASNHYISQFNQGKEYFIERGVISMHFHKDIVDEKQIIQALYLVLKHIIKCSPHAQTQRLNVLRAIFVNQSYYHHVFIHRVNNIERIMEKENAIYILGLRDDFDKDLLSKQYKKLCSRYHPDKQGVADDREFKIISKAYNLLKND